MTTKESVKDDGQKIVEDILFRSMFAKTEMCKEQAMSDNPAMMFFLIESDETNPEHDACIEFQNEMQMNMPYHTVFVPLLHKEEVLDCIDDVVKALPIAKFEYVVLAVEAYGRQLPTPISEMSETEVAEAISYEKGELEREFQENPFTDVKETLVVTAVDFSRNYILNGIVTYSYDDFGCPKFDEPIFHCTEITETAEFGRAADTLIAVCRYMEVAIVASSFQEMMNKARKDK